MNAPKHPLAGVPSAPAIGAPATNSPGTSNANKRAETAGVSGSPAEAPATSIGAGENSSAYCPTGEAGAPFLSTPTFTCRNCEGSGETEIMGLTDTAYRWARCHDCDGSGVEEPYCGACQGKLTCDLFCVECDSYESLIYVERISPTRIAL